MYLKIKGFIISPGKAFSSVKSENLKPSVFYMLALLLFSSLTAGGVSALLGSGIDAVVPLLIGYYITGLLGNLAIGLWLHVFAFAFGGRGLGSSLKAVFYGSTPSYLLGWSVAFGGVYLRLLLIAWNFILYWIGIRKLQSIPRRKAGIAIALSLATGLALYLAIAFVVFTYYLPFLYSF